MPDTHHHWMARAIRLARKGYYSTHPNPRVGCVIVRDGEEIATGFHEYPGGPHAEINALSAIEAKADGATVYVTLEPCSHSGKTPPCSDALISARPRRVVVAMTDPNPLVAGSGIEKLRQAGIEVIPDVLKVQAEALNPGFISRMTRQRPFVRIKMAMSLDGRTALANGLSQWITAEDARHDVQYLRAASSAILSSAETVIADDAALNVRLSQHELRQETAVRQPVRIIIDNRQRLSGREKLFTMDGDIWLVNSRADEAYRSQFDHPRLRFIEVEEKDDGHVNLQFLLAKLAAMEINELHTECGAALAGALIRQRLADELVIYMAPSLLGNHSRGLFDLGEISIMSDKMQLAIDDMRNVGRDIRITARVE